MATGTGRAETGLGGAAGYGEAALPRSDDGAMRLDLSAVFGAGLVYFGRRFAATDVFVNTNGTLSFGAAYPAYPTAGNSLPGADLIAPFWSDVDTRLRGEGRESGTVHVDIDPVADGVSITWDNVGSYRRDTGTVNRFQLQLFDRVDGDFDIVLRYEALAWTTGSSADDAGARALLASPRLAEPVWVQPGAAGAAMAQLDQIRGNSGVTGLWVYEMRGGALPGAEPARGVVRQGTAAADTLDGGASSDILHGRGGPDILRGGLQNDTLFGGDGADVLNGGAGDDFLFGGDSAADLRDVIYGGPGHDRAAGGHGNDLIWGEDGNDRLEGGFGADELQGQAGNDTLLGGALGDLIFGGLHQDYLDGGFGFDRLNGGAGPDRFFHLGIRDHGSDWLQDYRAGEGDRLVLGSATATRAQFQVNFATTSDAGAAGVAEAFVIWRPTGQILWALVDGAAQDRIIVQAGGNVFDLG